MSEKKRQTAGLVPLKPGELPEPSTGNDSAGHYAVRLIFANSGDKELFLADREKIAVEYKCIIQ